MCLVHAESLATLLVKVFAGSSLRFVVVNRVVVQLMVVRPVRGVPML
jgi:hypothetical protein